MSTDELVAVGRVGKAHGLRGEVALEAWTDDPEQRFVAGAVLRRPDAGDLTIESVRRHGDRWLVLFGEVADRTAAEQIRGAVVYTTAGDRPALEDPDEFYDSDLIGLRALDPRGALIGAVVDVVHSAAGTHLVVELTAAGADVRPESREQLVPFVAAVVPTVDVAAGTVVIDAPDGLFDL